MKRVFIFIFVLLLVQAGCSSSNVKSSGANNFPEESIDLIVPYSPGGATDRTARILAESVSEYLPNNQNIVIENKEGGGSTVGLTSLYSAKPDGYTLGLTMETGVATKTNTDNLTYDWDSFEEIMTLVQSPQLLIVRADSQWNTFDDWLEYVKKNPGKFKYGNSGVGSIGHLAMEQLIKKTGIDIVGVPYEGGGSSKQALLAGQTDGDIGSQADVDPELNKVLVNLGEEIEGVDAPEMSEFVDDSGVVPWIGLLAPPDTDEERIQVIHDAFKQAIEDPKTIGRLKKLYIAPYYNGPDEFKSIIQDRYKTIGELVKDLDMEK